MPAKADTSTVAGPHPLDPSRGPVCSGTGRKSCLDTSKRGNTLRALLLSLKRQLDEDWHRYLTTLLINPLGSNLRNVHAHGLVARATREEAAALIHVAAYLTFLELTTR